MIQNDARRKIQELVTKYEQVKTSGKLNKYSEQDTKDSFIRPMFEALGWDFDNRDEVSKEEYVNSAGRVDYGIYLNNQPKLFIEAKKLGADIHKPEFAEQAIRYCFNRVVTWAVLTDFESLKVFNSQNISENLSNKLYFEIPYNQYVERFDQVWQLSKESFEAGLIDKEATKVGKLQQKITVTEQLAKDLNEIRDLLTHSLHAWNPDVLPSGLDEGVQKLLDRLIFLRVAEDRGIEEPILKQLIRDYKNSVSSKQHLYESMIAKFRELDDIYNSGLFSEHPFEKWEEYSGATEKAIDILYGKSGYYEYDFKFIPSDVLGQVYENYLGHLLSKSRKGLTLDVSAKKRKEQGIYYTPSYIEEYIVEEALKPILDKCNSVAELKTIKVLDPACGSGSFLIKSMDIIEKKYVEFGARKGEGIRLQILLDNIYGVDLDEKAVEIARLNLVINSLETRMKLPGLEQHIKNGNSLISGSAEDLKKYFGKNYRDKKPFNWEDEFPEVFNRPNPGFDVIIGNPPYVSYGLRDAGKLTKAESDYYKVKYPRSAQYKISVYAMFMELALRLCRENGSTSFIVPDSFILGQYYQKIRQYLLDKRKLKKIALLKYPVFIGASTGASVIYVTCGQNNSIISTRIILSEAEFNIISEYDMNPKYYEELPLNRFRLFKDCRQKDLIDKIEARGRELSSMASIHTGIRSKIGQDKISSRVDSGIHWKDGLISGSEINRYVVDRAGYKLLIDKSKLWAGGFRDDIVMRPKILIRQTADRIVAALDNNGLYHLNNIHTLILINNRNEQKNLKFLLGLLNSKLTTYFYKTISLEDGRAMAQTDIETIEKLPLALPQTISKDYFDRLSVLVGKIIDLNSHFIKSKENTNVWTKYREDIKKIDCQIDVLVYELYELTKEEIEIVESSIN